MQSNHKVSPIFTFNPLVRQLLNLMICASLSPSTSYANPVLAQIVNGQVDIDTSVPGTTTVTNSPNAIINWHNFDIKAGEVTQFVQQTSQSAVLNRVIEGNASEIFGQLVSNGKVFLINPNGVVFGQGSTVDTYGLIASSLDLSNTDFLSGSYHFIAADKAGKVSNEGIIRSWKDGNVLFLAPDIENTGKIQTEGGQITLAAGQKLTVTNLQNPEIRFEIQSTTDKVLNVGQLLSEGGAINVFAGSIKHSGEINANSVVTDTQGNIQLVAKDDINLMANSSLSGNLVSTTAEQGTFTAKDTNLSVTQMTVDAQGKVNLTGTNTIQGDLSLTSRSADIYSRTKGVSHITSLNAPNGSIDVINKGGFIIGSNEPSQAKVVNAKGDINIAAQSPLIINGGISSSGAVNLTASSGALLTVNGPVTAFYSPLLGTSLIHLLGGSFAGSYAQNYVQYFSNGSSSNSSSSNGVTQVISTKIADSMLSATTPLGPQNLVQIDIKAPQKEQVASNFNSESDYKPISQPKSIKECIK